MKTELPNCDAAPLTGRPAVQHFQTPLTIISPLSSPRLSVARPPRTNVHRRPLNHRAVVIELLGGACSGCHSTARLEIDHKIPVSEGGKDDPSNLQLLCHECHRKKHGIFGSEPEHAEAAMMGVPKHLNISFRYAKCKCNCGCGHTCDKRYGPYFFWTDGDCSSYIGKSEKLERILGLERAAAEIRKSTAWAIARDIVIPTSSAGARHLNHIHQLVHTPH